MPEEAAGKSAKETVSEKAKEKEKLKPKAEKAKRTVDKWKRKQWFAINASPEFDRKQIGETVSDKPKKLVGRKIIANLAELTGQRQRRHVSIIFQINDVQAQNASTVFKGHAITPSYMGRLVKRHSSKVEINRIVQTKDNRKLKVKAVALSAHKITRSQEKALRKALDSSLAKACEKHEFSQAIQEIAFGVLATKLFKQLKKIVPLKRLEILNSEVIEG